MKNNNKKFTCPSWLNMKIEVDGYEIEINTSLSFVSIWHKGFECDNWYFQGHEADEVIDEINEIYNIDGTITAPEAVIKWANNMLY